jgi:hypothetical protein
MGRKIFISYARANRAAVESLEADLKGCGHDPFLDRELSGGQPWWDELLRQIEQCDIFVPILSAAYLKSVACGREADYAIALNKPILPVTIEAVRASLFSQRIAEAQWITYDAADRKSLLGLVRATDSIPPAPSLPESMPKRPAVPISYLIHLRDEVQTAGDLSPSAQLRLLSELRSRLPGDDADDARLLLNMLRQRPDVSHQVATEIDQVLATGPTPPHQPSKPKPAPEPTLSPRPSTPSPVLPSAFPKPNNYLVWSIVATVLCCLPVGAVGIYFALQVDKRYAIGDVAGAEAASKQARLWAIIAAGASVVCWVTYFIFMAFGAMATR